MSCHVLENAGESPGFDRRMARNDFMVFAVTLSGDTNVRSLLTRNFISQNAESDRELTPVDVPGEFHAAITSSRT